MKQVDQLASNALDLYFGILKLLFFSALMSHVEDWFLCWLRLGDDQQAPDERWSGFGRGRSILSWRALWRPPSHHLES